MKRWILWVTVAALAVVAPRAADAFCGFYVADSDQQLLNDATQVVLMRKGTRTVLSMQNNYKGPPDAFAMVIPVPVVLHEGDVKTLTREVFQDVERMGAPRLVEYWEQDPCRQFVEAKRDKATNIDLASLEDESAGAPGMGVKVEAKFTVGEYQIVILSAKDSTGLDAWLRAEDYNIPAGAEPLLRPYVETGMKFFVAKVDPAKVKFEGGRAALSPLRFHYDADELVLPIRLGLANSSGTQDLIINIFAPGQRYEVANYPNVTIPTNIDLKPSAKSSFGSFYAALFDRTLEQHKGAVVTEYAWQAMSCDPCPGPTLTEDELEVLGADVLEGPIEKPRLALTEELVHTRLHARYGKDIKNDLVFKQAKPITGGREEPGPSGHLEEGAQEAMYNFFQARYAIRYPWSGPIRCINPVRGVWGGPPSELATADQGVKPALDLAFVERDAVQLASVVARDIPEIGVRAGVVDSPQQTTNHTISSGSPKGKSGCGCQTTDGGDVLWGGLLVGTSMLVRRRRRR